MCATATVPINSTGHYHFMVLPFVASWRVAVDSKILALETGYMQNALSPLYVTAIIDGSATI